MTDDGTVGRPGTDADTGARLGNQAVSLMAGRPVAGVPVGTPDHVTSDSGRPRRALDQPGSGPGAAVLLRDVAAFQASIGNAATAVLVQRQRGPHYSYAPQELRPEDATNDEGALERASVDELITLYLVGFRLHRLPSTGAVYSREWVLAPDGTALVVGHLRAKLAAKTDRPRLEQWFLTVADETRGMADRRERVRGFVREAFARSRAGLRGGVALVEGGHQGRTMAPRGADYPGRIHAAMDVPGEEGTAAYAPVDGTVVFSGRKRGYGNVVIVFHERPPATREAGSGPVATTYCHLTRSLVRAGQAIGANQAVGTVGRTGAGEGAVRSGMGPHLHFSVLRVPAGAEGGAVARMYSSPYEERHAINPALWLGQLGTGISPGVTPRWEGEPVAPAPEVVQRRDAGAQSMTLARQAPTVTVQRDPDNAPEQLLPSRLEELFRLYLSEDEVTTLAPSGETYGRTWVRGDLGSARIRDVIREKLTTKTDRPQLREWFLAEITRLGGPADRQEDLRLAVDATFQGGPRLEDELVEHGNRRLTAQGYMTQMQKPPNRTDTADRPQIIGSELAMVEFEDATVHPAVVAALRALMAGLHAEGARLNDESARRARVASGWRPSQVSEGHLYLAALRKTIQQGVDPHGNPYAYPPFPASLEGMATSELGASGSPAHQAFVAALATMPAWSAASASMLVRTTGRFKAPRGGSTHHSGVVVDIDWPVQVGHGVVNHGMRRERNGAALRTVAGRWLYDHAPAFGFDTYDTAAEIWHMEWRLWRGTAADPAQTGSSP